MKPPNHLITIWQEHLLLKAQAQVATGKADLIYAQPTIDKVLRVRADAYAKTANRLNASAGLLFRKALTAEYGRTTHRIEWQDDHTCTVWVRKKYTKQEHPLHFHRSLRQSGR